MAVEASKMSANVSHIAEGGNYKAQKFKFK